jgi:glycosyltransferase involved in cell wall biosynthesis
MSKRTVLVLPAWYPTARQPLAGPFIRDHARAAAAYGHDVVVVVDEGPRNGLRGLFELRTEEDEALTVVRFSARPGWGRFVYLPALLLIARRLARAGRPIQVLHAHVYWMGWVAVLAGALLRRPVVISEHSSVWPRHMLGRGALWRARIAFRRAALVCPVDERLQRAIERYGLRARFRVVPNTVDTAVFHAPPSFNSEEDPTLLVNVALHVEVKALDVLLHAFARLTIRRSSLTLEMIGDGPLTGDLQILANNLGIAERVRFRGRLSAREIAEALQGSDVLVVSSHSENLPLAVLEALCCGLPVAATNVGGIPGAVGTNGALARPGNAEALADAIEDVLRRYADFDRQEIAARAAARYSFEAVGRVWHEIYCSV